MTRTLSITRRWKMRTVVKTELVYHETIRVTQRHETLDCGHVLKMPKFGYGIPYGKGLHAKGEKVRCYECGLNLPDNTKTTRSDP